MIYDSPTVNSKCFSVASYEVLPLNVHYAQEPLLGAFTNSSSAKKKKITTPHGPINIISDIAIFFGTLCRPTGRTPALR